MSSRLLANLRTQWDDTVSRMTAITDIAANDNRDLNDVERANFGALEASMAELQPRITQLVEVERSLDTTAGLFASVSDQGREQRAVVEAPARAGQYATAGEYLYDVMRSFGAGADLDARRRIQSAALVNRTTINGATVADLTLDDIVGIVPETIVGPVWKAIDAIRPVHNTLTARPLTSALMFRPKVTQYTQVGVQGTAGKLGSLKTTGAAVDEKKAFVSREMKLARIDIEPVALGGVVDVSLWAEMLNPGTIDMIVSDLAEQYAILSESIACAEVVRAGTVGALASIVIGPDTINKAIFTAAAQVYAATGKLPSRVGLSVDAWAAIGGLADTTKRPLYSAMSPMNAPGSSDPGTFVGQVSQMQWVVSPGLAAGTIVVYAPSDIETYERRLGVLQAVEPERAGKVVSYSGLYTAKAMADGAACKIPYTLV